LGTSGSVGAGAGNRSGDPAQLFPSSEEYLMTRTITAFTVLLSGGFAAPQQRAGGPGGPANDQYVRIEIKGTVSMSPQMAFGPKFDTGEIRTTGHVWVGSRTAFFELLIEEKRHFDLLKANDLKTVVISGDLDLIAVPKPPIPLASPPHTPSPEIRRVIRVRDVRLPDAKEDKTQPRVKPASRRGKRKEINGVSSFFRCHRGANLLGPVW